MDFAEFKAWWSACLEVIAEDNARQKTQQAEMKRKSGKSR